MANFFKITSGHEKSIQNYKNALVFRDEDLQRYKDIMSVFDADGDGALDSQEIKLIWLQIRQYAEKDGNASELSKSEAEDLILNHLKNWRIRPDDLVSFISNITSTLGTIEKKQAAADITEEVFNISI